MNLACYKEFETPIQGQDSQNFDRHTGENLHFMRMSAATLQFKLKLVFFDLNIEINYS